MVVRTLITWLYTTLATLTVPGGEDRHENAQGLVEYALILTFVAVGITLVLVFLAPNLGNIYSGILEALQL